MKHNRNHLAIFTLKYCGTTWNVSQCKRNTWHLQEQRNVNFFLPCGCMEQYLHKLTQEVIFGSEYTPVRILTRSWGCRNTYVPVKWVIKKKKMPQCSKPNQAAVNVVSLIYIYLKRKHSRDIGSITNFVCCRQHILNFFLSPHSYILSPHSYNLLST